MDRFWTRICIAFDIKNGPSRIKKWTGFGVKNESTPDAELDHFRLKNWFILYPKISQCWAQGWSSPSIFLNQERRTRRARLILRSVRTLRHKKGNMPNSGRAKNLQFSQRKSMLLVPRRLDILLAPHRPSPSEIEPNFDPKRHHEWHQSCPTI